MWCYSFFGPKKKLDKWPATLVLKVFKKIIKSVAKNATWKQGIKNGNTQSFIAKRHQGISGSVPLYFRHSFAKRCFTPQSGSAAIQSISSRRAGIAMKELKMSKKKEIYGSENVAVFPTFKCDEDELAILTAMIAVCDKNKPVDSITGCFKSSPWFFSMEPMNADAANEDSCLSIETGTSVSLCDIVGDDYWNSLDDDQRVAVGPCLLKMIEEDLLQAEFSVGDSDFSVASAKSKKVSRRK